MRRKTRKTWKTVSVFLGFGGRERSQRGIGTMKPSRSGSPPRPAGLDEVDR